MDLNESAVYAMNFLDGKEIAADYTFEEKNKLKISTGVHSFYIMAIHSKLYLDTCLENLLLIEREVLEVQAC